jgi:broad specificity phosphatase PhoE
LHNVHEAAAKEEAKARGGSLADQEAARKSVLKNPSFKDAPLSKSGEMQVDQAAGSFAELLGETHYPAPEKVIVSPLERTLQTATRLFGKHKSMHAKEFLREKRTGLPCDERKHSKELVLEFPHIEFSDVVAYDSKTNLGYTFVDPTTQKEENDDVKVRSKQLLEFVKDQEAEVVAVVAHKGFIREFINGPLAGLLDASGKELKAHAVFGNAEIWVLEAVWNLDNGPSPRIRAHSLQAATSLPHMSLSSPLPPPPPLPFFTKGHGGDARITRPASSPAALTAARDSNPDQEGSNHNHRQQWSHFQCQHKFQPQNITRIAHCIHHFGPCHWLVSIDTGNVSNTVQRGQGSGCGCGLRSLSSVSLFILSLITDINTNTEQ